MVKLSQIHIIDIQFKNFWQIRNFWSILRMQIKDFMLKLKDFEGNEKIFKFEIVLVSTQMDVKWSTI